MKVTNKMVHEAIKQAETQGFSKFTTENGVKMVVCTQSELDAVIAQAKSSKKDLKGDL